MPTYSYICDACGHRFEQFQTIVEEPIKICPECEEERVRRLIVGGAGLIFKGSGFYITDYARSKVPGQERSPASDGSKEKTDKVGKPDKIQKGSHVDSERSSTSKTNDK